MPNLSGLYSFEMNGRLIRIGDPSISVDQDRSTVTLYFISAGSFTLSIFATGGALARDANRDQQNPSIKSKHQWATATLVVRGAPAEVRIISTDGEGALKCSQAYALV